jgi:hypothetical protein
VGSEQRQLRSSPPRGEQPEDADEQDQTESAVRRADDELVVDAHRQRQDGHRGEQRQADVRSHDDARIGQQRQQQRHQQHPLRDRLADGLRYRKQNGAGIRQHIDV